MSDLGRHDDPIFKGHTPGGITCAQFVRAVRKHAITENKARNYEYIADYAMSCLDDEALNWSETLSIEVQGDWTLLRRALLAEYNTVGHQSAYSSASIIPSAMVPVPAAAPPFPTRRSVAIQNVVPPSAATTTTMTPVPAAVPPFQPPRPLFSRPSIGQTNSTNTRYGRIRVTMVGYKTYYITTSNVLLAWCRITDDIHEAAALEAVGIDKNVEFKFMSSGRGSAMYLGMVWNPSQIKAGSHAGVLPVERDGQKVINPTGIPSPTWQGAVSVMTYTSSVDGVLAPVLGTDKGGIMVNLPSSSLYITNNVPTFLKVYPNLKEAKCVFEPL